MTPFPAPLRPGHSVGLSERQVGDFSGVASKMLTLISTGGATIRTMRNCILYNQGLNLASTDWTAVTPDNVVGPAVWVASRLPFAATPSVTLTIAGNSAGLSIPIQFRMTGLDGFGRPLQETTPVIPLVVTTDVETVTFWMGRCFSRIDKIEYKWGLPLGTIAIMNVGLFFTWDPALIQSDYIFDFDGPTIYRSRYLVNLNQGLHLQLELVGTRGDTPNLYPEVLSMQVSTGAPAVNTTANVKPRLTGSGAGFTLAASDVALLGVDSGTGGSGTAFQSWDQDPHKLRINSTAGIAVTCYDGSTEFPFYTPKVDDVTGGGADGLPERANTVIYMIQVRAGKQQAARMAKPNFGG
jgi:hypothetical protein